MKHFDVRVSGWRDGDDTLITMHLGTLAESAGEAVSIALSRGEYFKHFGERLTIEVKPL